jgi:hemolysin activation/secretion protein
VLLALLTCVAHADAPSLTATVINGTSAYTPGELFSVYRDQLGRPISSAGAQAIVAQIEAMYARDGYSRPEFRLDANLTGSGILRIEVFEASITQVRVSGDAGPYTNALATIGETLRGQMPLRTSALQGALAQMRELPGLTIKAATRRDAERPNGYVLEIEASFKALDAVFELSNRGTDQIGPVFAVAQLISNDAMHLNERFGLVYSGALDAKEFTGGGMFLDVPVAARGTHVTMSYFVSKSDPTERPNRNDAYWRERASLRVTEPLPLFDAHSRDTLGALQVALFAGIDFDDLDLAGDGERVRSEKLRVAELGARMTARVSPTLQYLIVLEARQGLDGLGSALAAYDLAYDTRRRDFLLTRLQLTQVFGFAEAWTTRLDVFGQQSAYVLPDAERYKIGGERLGRGFEVTEIAGDQGIGAKAELRRELTNAASSFGRTALYGFYDFGAAWKQDLPDRESAVTAGLGFAIDYRRFAGYVEVARPLTHADVEGKREPRVFASLSVRL